MGAMSQVVDALEEARAAAARQSWRAAYGAFVEAGDGGLTASDLENYGEAAWWSGKLDEAISLRERAYSAYTAAGDLLGAARMALTIQWDYEARGSFAVANGWMANAERLLADLPEAPEHARLALIKALTAMFAQGDYARAIELFDEAYELASRVGDRDSQMLALSGKGRANIKLGEIDAGLSLLDEATASAMCGDLRAHTSGLVYCITISSCQDLGDYRRAAEWTEAANRFCDKLDVSGFPGACRIHRAEVLRLRGDWSARRGAGDGRVRGAPRLRPLDHRIRALRDRARSVAAAATSRERRRRTASRTRWAASPSRGSRSCGLPRGRSTPQSPGSR